MSFKWKFKFLLKNVPFNLKLIILLNTPDMFLDINIFTENAAAAVSEFSEKKKNIQAGNDIFIHYQKCQVTYHFQLNLL